MEVILDTKAFFIIRKLALNLCEGKLLDLSDSIDFIFSLKIVSAIGLINRLCRRVEIFSNKMVSCCTRL